LYHYDHEGRLLAETTPAGNTIAEYVWVGYRPVALIVPTNPPGDDDDDDDNDDNDNDDDDNNDNNDNNDDNDDNNDDSSPGDDDDDDDSFSCGGSHFKPRYRPSFLVRSAEAADREERDFVVYAIHTDHLGTPIAMTDESGQIAWPMRLSPFGRVLELNEDADGDGVPVPLNLRFPGQYYDEVN